MDNEYSIQQEFQPKAWLTIFAFAGGIITRTKSKAGDWIPAFAVPCNTQQEIEMMPKLNKMLADLTDEQKAAIRPHHEKAIGGMA